MGGKAPDFRVLLYQGPVELAKVIAEAAPEFNIILCLGKEDEPPGKAEVVGNTFVIRVGHKGKNIGVVGVFPPKAPGGPYRMEYERVLMAPEYKTPPGQEKGHPILALLESYHKELKEENYLARRYGKVPHSTQAAIKEATKKGTPAALIGLPSGYVGSAECGRCHKEAFKIWAATDHAKAYATLVKATNPSLSEYNPECIVCHTVGYRYQGGFADAATTPLFKDVGCESCHGPGEAHVKNKGNKALYALINPWKGPPAPPNETPEQEKERERQHELRMESMCRECHDSENDVKWKTFAPKWAKVAH
jgi:hypothetical protein